VVKRILLSAREAGSEIEFIRLTDLRLEPCRGCFRCLRDGRCVLEDGLEEILSRALRAEALVLAAPVYFLAPAASVIHLLDRLLVMARRPEVREGRRAVTATLMGSRAWRGLAEPYVNMTAGLLGFNLAESLTIEAQGPGSVLSAPEAARLPGLGRALAVGGEIRGEPAPGACPVCRSDSFRVGSEEVICPVCGMTGDREEYLKSGRLTGSREEVRWGVPWIKRHVASWIEPSVRKFMENRRAVLEPLRLLRGRYDRQERGKT
jgi:hypothetical protein